MKTVLSRRTFLSLTAATLPLAPKLMTATQGKKIPVGLELYSVRDEYTRNLAGTVTAVAKMGYEVVEFWAPFYVWTPSQA